MLFLLYIINIWMFAYSILVPIWCKTLVPFQCLPIPSTSISQLCSIIHINLSNRNILFIYHSWNFYLPYPTLVPLHFLIFLFVLLCVRCCCFFSRRYLPNILFRFFFPFSEFYVFWFFRTLSHLHNQVLL